MIRENISEEKKHIISKKASPQTKEELKMFRDSIKEKEYTEVNLQYKSGEYVLTYVDKLLTKSDLYFAGMIKRREAKAYINPQKEKEVRAKERALRSHDNFTLLMPKKSKKN